METKPENTLPGDKRNSTLNFILSHKLVSFLLLVLLVGTGWTAIKLFSLKRNFNKEKAQITSKFVDETSRVFSWAVRSEMIRDNREQVNQFFMNLVKEPGFKKIQLVDVRSSKVIVSTDKKDEGVTVTDTSILNANEVRQQINDGIIRSITPVMGLNSRIAVLVIDRQNPIQVDEGMKE